MISERVKDTSPDEVLALVGVKLPRSLDRRSSRIGQVRMSWCGPATDRIGHAVAALVPAETAADGPEMGRPRINGDQVCALSARRGARHCLAVFKTRSAMLLTCGDSVAARTLGTYSAQPHECHQSGCARSFMASS